MKNIKEIINGLQNKGFILLRMPRKEGEDIDMFFYDLNKASNLLEEYGFVMTNKQKNFIEAVKYIDKSLVIIEVANTLLRSSKIRVKLKKIYEYQYLENPTKNDIWLRSLRYILALRRDKKAIDFFNKNKDLLMENNFYLNYLENNPFNCINLDLFFKNKLLFIYKCLGVKCLILLSYKKFKFHLESIKKRKIIGIVGVDGAGKSYVIEILTKYNIKTIYMGFKEFKFEKSYKKIIGKNVFFTFFVHFFVFIENWVRLLKAKLYNLRGYDVIFDRYPKIEYQLTNNFANRLIYNLFYKYLFPKVRTIALYADPNIILKRKKELSLEEITFQQNKIKSLVDVKIKNEENICNVVNLVLKELYEGNK